jgi:hypothetical protein
MGTPSSWPQYFKQVVAHIQRLDGWVEFYAQSKDRGQVSPAFTARLSQYMESVNTMVMDLYVGFNAVKMVYAWDEPDHTEWAYPEFRTALMAQSGLTADQINDTLTSYHASVSSKLGEPISVSLLIALLVFAISVVATVGFLIYNSTNQSRKAATTADLLEKLPALAASCPQCARDLIAPGGALSWLTQDAGMFAELGSTVATVGKWLAVGAGAWYGYKWIVKPALAERRGET